LSATQVPAAVVLLQWKPAPQLQAMAAPVQVLVTDVLQVLPQLAVLVQHEPSAPAPTVMPPDEHTRPPVQLHV
jgi:hypothetical protein